jgi:two-component system NarL family response regulator/two-component system nitrate/nitrite response regulator NarL
MSNRTRLTPREREIASLVARGYCNKRIARELGLTLGTVKVNLANMFTKLEINNRTMLAMYHERNVDA